MIDLLDVNVWVGFVSSSHPSHALAMDYWTNKRRGQLAFNRTTMLGFMRVSTNPKALQRDAMSFPEFWENMEKLRARQDILWVEEPTQRQMTSTKD